MITGHYRLLLTASASLSLHLVNAQAGTMDPTFGIGGFVVTDLVVTSYDRPRALALQTDGKILVAAELDTNLQDLALLRYLPDGTLDGTFGPGGTGIVTYSDPAHPSEAVGLVVQPDGTILLGAETYTSTTSSDLTVMRFLANGTLDPAFGSGGLARIHPLPPPDDDDEASCMVVLPNGKILMIGENDGLFLIARFNADGTVDTTFGSGGFVTTDVDPQGGFPYAAVLQPDGKFLVTGQAGSPSTDLIVVRYLPDGELDSTFSSDGIVDLSMTAYSERGMSILVDPAGRILVGVREFLPTDNTFAVIRFLPNGSIDPSFDGGFFTFSPGVDTSSAIFDMALQPYGEILIGGSIQYATGVGDNDFLVARLNSDGTLDPSFGGDGYVFFDTPGYSGSTINKLMLYDVERILLVGASVNPGSDDVVLARLHTGLQDAIGGPAGRPMDLAIFPNPAHETIEAHFTLIHGARVSIVLLDAAGRELGSLMMERNMAEGGHAVRLALPEGLAPGLYQVRITAGEERSVVKLAVE